MRPIGSSAANLLMRGQTERPVSPLIDKFKIGMLIFILFCVPRARASEADPPAPLSAWKDPSYTQRYFIKVESPGEAGGEGLQTDPYTASLRLPLKSIGADGAAPRIESVFLHGEDGEKHAIHLRQIGSETEISFKTRPGLRRFCLYTGAANGTANNASPLSFQPVETQVKMRGRSAPADFVYTEKNPLTLERFKALEQSGGAVLDPRHNGQAPVRVMNINDPECPFFGIKVDQFGHIMKIDNPPHYTALYEAFLRAPVGGIYKFALDTPGAAHLLIDAKEVIGADAPDPNRNPFALNRTVELSEGLHRLVLYYAEANVDPAQTNMDVQRFGLRLHWQPPFLKHLICIPPQAFPSALPAVVTRLESSNGQELPFIQVEDMGQVRASASLGEQAAQNYALLMAKITGTTPGARVTLSVPGRADVSGSDTPYLCAWVPTGSTVTMSVNAAGTIIASRTVTLPPANFDLKEVLDLEGELVLKSAPDFLYTDETGYIHLEALLSPAPVIIFKERTESKLVPPLPHPMGQFQLNCFLKDDNGQIVTGANALGLGGDQEATPLEGLRKKLTLPVSAASLKALADKSPTRLVLQLTVGDVEVSSMPFRLLNSGAAQWPGALQSGAGELFFSSANGNRSQQPTANSQQPIAINLERVMMLIEHQDESQYRKFAPLRRIGRGDIGPDALFVGDPMIEAPGGCCQGAKEGGVHNPNEQPVGMAKLVSAVYPNSNWKAVSTPGPHRHLPIFRMLAELDAYTRRHSGKVPGLAVVFLGSGDTARQTPLHTFERALDSLIDRLRACGAQKIVVVGVIPEPGRERQCEPYQERVQDVLRQYHLDGVDVFHMWTGESGWARRYALDGTGTSPVFGPFPNAQALEEIVNIIKDKL